MLPPSFPFPAESSATSDVAPRSNANPAEPKPPKPPKPPLLSVAERMALRAKAHDLEPRVFVGETGLTPAVIKEIALQLDSHGLIKLRLLRGDKAEREVCLDEICRSLGAASIGHIGRVGILYRAKVEKPEAGRKKTKGPGPRRVMVVKRSKNPMRPHHREEVLLKGNQRLTEGGLVKRLRHPQASRKRAAVKG